LRVVFLCAVLVQVDHFYYRLLLLN